MKKLIKNGQVFVDGMFVRQDLLIEKGQIVQMGFHLCETDAEVIDVDGKYVMPGFIDVHVHLREPGLTHKETIATGSLAAARGGWTQIAAMPNTRPVPDSEETMQLVQNIIQKDAVVKVHPYAAISLRQLGDELVDFEALSKMGAFAFTDDGVGVQSAGKMYEAMQRCAKLGQVIVAHCEDNSLLYKGVVHQGKYAKRQGLPDILSISESVQIARDVLLSEATGCRYHVCHISTKESVRVVRDAKRAGISVTAEVTPHHLLLCEDDIVSQDTNYKMNPPLRAREDLEALIEGLLDGTIDCIATDHAPHTEEEKASGLLTCPFGIVGSETAFPLLYTKLVQTGVFSLKQLVEWLTIKPAQLFNLTGGRIQVGAYADLTVIDLEKEMPIDKEKFLSKGKNTPFHGEVCKGWPIMTLVNGKIVWREDETK